MPHSDAVSEFPLLKLVQQGLTISGSPVQKKTKENGRCLPVLAERLIQII